MINVRLNTMLVKRKVRKLHAGRIFRSRGADGREVVVAPIVGADGKIRRFVVLDRTDPLPVPREESGVYLRVD